MAVKSKSKAIWESGQDGRPEGYFLRAIKSDVHQDDRIRHRGSAVDHRRERALLSRAEENLQG